MSPNKWDSGIMYLSNQEKRQEAELFIGDKAPGEEISQICLLPTGHIGILVPYWSLGRVPQERLEKEEERKKEEGDEMENILYVGIDYHKRSYTASYLDRVTGVIVTKRHTEEVELLEILRSYKREGYRIKVAIEMLTGSKNFARKLREEVGELYMIDTNSFKHVLKGVNRDKKTDKIDAETIVRYLEKGLLPVVYLPGEKIERLRKLLKMRESYVNHRRRVLNQTHSLLLEYGIKVKNREILTKKGIEKLKVKLEELYEEIKELVLLNIEMIKELGEKIKKIERITKGYVEKEKKFKEDKERLTSIPGVGEITALTFIGVIGEVERFSDGRKVGSYIGLVPRIYSSDEKVSTGRITKKGDSTLRNKLLQAAIALINSKVKNSLKEFFIRLIRKGVNKNKARIAIARKLAIVMYSILKEGRNFECYLNKNFAT